MPVTCVCEKTEELSTLIDRLEEQPALLNDPGFSNAFDIAMTVTEASGPVSELVRARHILSTAEQALLSA